MHLHYHLVMKLFRRLLGQSTLTDRYQTTIPNAVRKQLGLGKRDLIEFVQADDGSIVLRRAETYAAEEFPEEMQRWRMEDESQVKISSGWLIEHAGIPKGYHLPGSKAAISQKHALAITNTGGASAEEILQLARYVQERVAARWGINLIPEPNLIGF